MNMCALPTATLVLLGGPASAAPTARPVPAARPAPKVAPTPPMVFDVVKGAPVHWGAAAYTYGSLPGREAFP
jgi:hypothetical protein